jgi:hypothetical protein
MPWPDAHAVAASLLDSIDDQGERLLPRARFPGIFTPPSYTSKRRVQSSGIIDDLVSSPTPEAQKAPAIRILEIALDADKPVFFQLDGHAAVGGMTIHGTHGGDLTLCHSLFLLEASRCLSRRLYGMLNFVSSCASVPLCFLFSQPLAIDTLPQTWLCCENGKDAVHSQATQPG